MFAKTEISSSLPVFTVVAARTRDATWQGDEVDGASADQFKCRRGIDAAVLI